MILNLIIRKGKQVKREYDLSRREIRSLNIWQYRLKNSKTMSLTHRYHKLNIDNSSIQIFILIIDL